ncbi:hypothetical protein P4G82_23705 [Bacillus cereus]|nr:hypothetical protein [Bacillus cereus]
MEHSVVRLWVRRFEAEGIKGLEGKCRKTRIKSKIRKPTR